MRSRGPDPNAPGPAGQLELVAVEYVVPTPTPDELTWRRCDRLRPSSIALRAAIEAGYELGYVNGAGNRIITGCIAHPTAGAMG
jgi:hypothetical protein